MAIETKYICDRCGHAQTTPEQMWGVGICFGESMKLFSSHINTDIKHKRLWCRTCCESIHMLPPGNKEKTEHIPEAAPGFEDILREIIREEIGQMTGAV